MIKLFLVFALLISVHNYTRGQSTESKVMYIVDSVPVIEDPEPGNEITRSDIADITVIRNKDSLRHLGYEQFDVVTYIFTKEYRNRPENIKMIPHSSQLIKKNGLIQYNGGNYSGAFIDYYYSGRKRSDGQILNGKLNGLHKYYFQNGKVSSQREFVESVANGPEVEYYEDGSIKQKGVFVNGKESGIWEMYYPNGQVKQKSNFNDGQMIGDITIFYSSGKVLATETEKNGKITPDKKYEKIDPLMKKGHESTKEKDFKNAIKYYSKVIALDSTYAEAYFARGTAYLDNLQFDESIADFDKAIQLEPFMEYALSNRAFARIRRHQLGNSRTLSKNAEVTILATKDNLPLVEADRLKICNDLQKAVFLGQKSKMITDAQEEYCKSGSNQ